MGAGSPATVCKEAMSEETPGVPKGSETVAVEDSSAVSPVPAPPLTTIANLGKHEGASVTLHAWLYNLRASGKLLFPIFRDGTGTIQGIVPKAAVSAEVFETIRHLTQESSVIVTGKVRADARAPRRF